MNNYKQIFDDLKAYGKVTAHCPMTRQETRMLNTLEAMGFVSANSDDGCMVFDLLPQTIKPGETFIQVSHWKDGRREGKFSQAKYEATHRYGNWMTYKLTDTMIHVIPIKRTRKVA